MQAYFLDIINADIYIEKEGKEKTKKRNHKIKTNINQI